MAEVIRRAIRNTGRERRKIVATYEPPKTNTWKIEEHKVMQKEVLKCQDDVIRKDKKVCTTIRRF